MIAWRKGDGLALVTVGWTMMWCGDVVTAWRHSPYDHFGWVAAMGWAAAAGMAGRRASSSSGMWLAGAWVASTVGVAGELNVAQHAGLALAGAAWGGGGWRGFGLALLALGWMPVSGWVARGLGSEMVAGLRGLAGLIGLAVAWREGVRK